MRNQTLEVDIFTFRYDAALQEFKYCNLNLCLTNEYSTTVTYLTAEVSKCLTNIKFIVITV